MGLLDSVLNVPERLRVWQQSGVHYLYWDPAQPDAPDTPESSASADAPEASVPATDVPSPAPVETADSGAHAGPVHVAEPTAKAERPAASMRADPEPSRWPKAWSALLAKTPPQPSLVITYWELGYDLSGRSDPRRGNLWRSLIRDLGLSGRHAVAFWPFALPVGETLETRPDLFWAAMRRLAPPQIALFGQEAIDQLGSGAPRDGSVRLAVLPDPQTLLAGDTEVWKHVLTTLAADL